MNLLSRLTKPFRRTAEPPALVRSFDAQSGRRFGARANYASHGPETLAAGPTIRARARHAFANNGYIRNGVNAIVAEAVGAGIEATSAHPDLAIRAEIDAAFLDAAARIDAEGRTDLRGLTAAAVLAEIIDGEAFFLLEDRGGRAVLRQLPAEFVDESMTTELSGGGYIVAGIEFNALGERVALTVDQLVAARDALLDARASGVREVRDQNGETITYKGDREMAAALAALDREIAQATGRAAPTTLRFRTSKGT